MVGLMGDIPGLSPYVEEIFSIGKNSDIGHGIMQVIRNFIRVFLFVLVTGEQGK
jgi:hypothetical protein